MALEYKNSRLTERGKTLANVKKDRLNSGTGSSAICNIKDDRVRSKTSSSVVCNVKNGVIREKTGSKRLEEVKDIRKEIDLHLLGVSVLTSFNDEDLERLGFINKVEDQVKKLIKIAEDSNLHGVICSPLEIKMIKAISPNLKCFTPGIRMDAGKDDQKRTMSANEAFKEGSDCLIIGRPITKGNPKKNLKNILSSIK